MPMRLEGACRCGAVRFAIDSHTPYPYQRCYCSICRKTAGGYASNLMGEARSLTINDAQAIRIYHAEIVQPDGRLATSPAERHFCSWCATALWLFDPEWPDLIHPFASAIDTPLPAPPSLVHLMLRYKPDWVVPQIGPDDTCFDEYPEDSIEHWHRIRGLWID